MKLKIFTVHDAKAAAYLEPVYSANRGTIIRSISEVLANKQHQFAKYPADFTLFEIGEYDQTNGEITPITKVAVANLLDLLTDEKPVLSVAQ